MRANFLFTVWPYTAVVFLLAGILVRCLFFRGFTLANAQLSQTKSASCAIWRCSLAALAAFHLLVLAFPTAMLAWNSIPVRLYVAEAMGFVMGLLALGCCTQLMWVQLERSAATAIPEVCDPVFCVLLLLLLLSGCTVAVIHRWGSSWGAITLSPYLGSLLHGRPASAMVEHMPFLVRLHVFCAFAVVACFPLTRLSGTLVALIYSLLGSVDLAFIAFARGIGSWLRQYDPAPWLWPEED